MRLLRSVKTQFCHKKAQLFPVVPSIAKPTIVVCVAAPANRAQPTWSSDSQFIYFLLPWDDPGVFRVRVSDAMPSALSICRDSVSQGRSTFGWVLIRQTRHCCFATWERTIFTPSHWNRYRFFSQVRSLVRVDE